MRNLLNNFLRGLLLIVPMAAAIYVVWYLYNFLDFSGISYKKRGFKNPTLVGFMESHDKERLMYKNLEYGNSSGSYDIKYFDNAIDMS